MQFDVKRAINLIKEVQALRVTNLEKERILKLIEATRTNRNYYLVLEFCNAGDLSMLLKKHGTLSVDKA